MATINAIAISLVQEFGGTTSDTTWITQVEGYINEICQAIWRHDWQFTRTVVTVATVASTVEYDVGSSALQILSGRIVSPRRRLDYIPEEELNAYGVDFTIEGTPTAFWQSGVDSTTFVPEVTFYPIPNAVFSVKFSCKLLPPVLTSTSTIAWPEGGFTPVLKDGVRARMHMDDQDTDLANVCQARYMMGLEELKHYFLRQPARSLQKHAADLPATGIGILGNFPDNYGY